MIEAHTLTTASGRTYTVRTLPARKGWPIAMQLPKLLGGAVGALVAQEKGATDAAAMAAAFDALGTRLADPALFRVILDVLEGLTCDGRLLIDGAKADAFDVHFAENYGELIEVIVFAFRVNFSSFFAENPVVAKVAARLGAMVSAAPTPQPASPSPSPG